VEDENSTDELLKIGTGKWVLEKTAVGVLQNKVEDAIFLKSFLFCIYRECSKQRLKCVRTLIFARKMDVMLLLFLMPVACL
jgi:hypothetical protein